MLKNNVGNKVKIIHEAMPEMFLENYTDQQEQFSFGNVTKAIGNISLNTGKELLTKLVEKLINKLSALANDAIANYFKSRAAEFKQAQAEPQDGITVQIIWMNIQGMASVKAVINAIRGNLSIPNLADLSLPNIPTPEVKISAGKKFE
jgi:polyhydroxyalkanoate synthesis regulator protein